MTVTATRAARGRNALSYADRDRLAEVVPHGREMTTGIGASQRAACFGWVDDWRHA